MSKKSKAKLQTEIAGLINFQADSLQKIDKKFSEIESLADPSEKILKLRDLSDHLYSVEYAHGSKHYTIAWNQVKTFMHTWSSQDRQADKIKKRIREEHQELADFTKAMKSHKTRVSEMLDAIVTKDNMDAISESPLFSRVYKEHEPLRDLFTAVAASRAALGGKTPPAVEEAPEKKPVPKTEKKPYVHL